MRDRWALMNDGMYVSEFLQSGGYLWELESWMKHGVAWVEGENCHTEKVEYQEYLETKRRLKI